MLSFRFISLVRRNLKSYVMFTNVEKTQESWNAALNFLSDCIVEISPVDHDPCVRSSILYSYVPEDVINN